MAVDSTIQLFAHELFNSLWVLVGDKRRSFLTIPESLNVESHITAEIVDAVACRQILFREIYNKQFKHTGIANVDNPANFLSHICVAFDDTTFKMLGVFERIFATCAFVMEMSLFCLVNNNTYFLKEDFLCWAMYFDTELESEFYDLGGWKVLKGVAKSYVVPLLAIDTLSPESSKIHLHLDKYVTGMDDYNYYQKFEDFEHQTYAKSWVNFRLRNGENSRGSRFNYETIEGLESFLTCFKFLCDPLGERILETGVGNQIENLITKFNGNGYLENIIATKLAKLGCQAKQNCNLQDDLEIRPSPEVFKGQTVAEQGLIKSFQDLDIRLLSNGDEPVDQAIATQKPMFQTNTQDINELLESLQMKLSMLRCLGKQNSNLLEGLGISPSPEVFLGQTDEEQSLIRQFNGDEVIEQALTTQKPTFQSNDLSSDSLSNETNISPKNCLTVEEYKCLWDQVMSTDICFNNLTGINRIQAEKTAAVPRLQTQDPEKNLFKEDGSIHESDDENTYCNTGILQTYDLWRNKLNMSSVHRMLNHVPVFIDDHRIIQKQVFVETKTCEVTDNSNVKNDTPQVIKAAPLGEREVQNGKQRKKKKKKTMTVKEDTKDILRMVFVLGWQPGVNYIRSTLQQTYKTTSV